MSGVIVLEMTQLETDTQIGVKWHAYHSVTNNLTIWELGEWRGHGPARTTADPKGPRFTWQWWTSFHAVQRAGGRITKVFALQAIQTNAYLWSHSQNKKSKLFFISQDMWGGTPHCGLPPSGVTACSTAKKYGGFCCGWGEIRRLMRPTAA